MVISGGSQLSLIPTLSSSPSSISLCLLKSGARAKAKASDSKGGVGNNTHTLLNFRPFFSPLKSLLPRVQYHKHQIRAPRNRNNLLTPPFPARCALNDTGEVEDLDSGTFVVEVTGDAGEGSELVTCGFGFCLGSGGGERSGERGEQD